MLNRTQQSWDDAGFSHMTPVQEKVIPLFLEGKDLLAESPTGTGKTLAYVIPLVEKIDPSKRLPQAFILAPSKELSMQILEVVQTWGKAAGIRVTSMIGGANTKRQLEKLKKQPHIIVGTPGRMLELIKQKKLKAHEVKHIVLDEVDQLLLDEHKETVQSIIKSTLADQRQIAMFSATLPPETQEKAMALSNDPELVRIDRKAALSEGKVEHQYMVCESRDKIDWLRKIVRLDEMEGAKSLAFMKEVRDVMATTEKLTYRNLPVAPLHSDLSKEERAASMRKFRKGEVPLMVATDVATRGLDIEQVSHILHLDLAEDVDQYVHRSGRTGRAGASGTVLSLVTAYEEKQLKKYAKALNLELKEVSIYRGRWNR